MNAKFIVIEGLEGAGKTTIKEVVIQTLQQQGISNVLLTREPGGTEVGEVLRNLVKEKNVTDKAELLMMYAARAELVDTLIKPALASGQWVIGDRHDLSSQAYQGGGRAISNEVLQTLRDFVLETFRPDLTLYLDIDPKLGLERIQKRGALDRIEKQPITFFEQVRKSYLELAKIDSSIVTIDASRTLQEVAEQVQSVIEQRFFT